MTDTATESSRARGFFIGGRKLPKRHWVALIVMLPLVAVIVFGGALLLGEAQPPAGDGFWQQTENKYTGTVRFEPYPVLVDFSEGGARSYLLVSEGKFGAMDLVADLDGIVTDVQATLIERDNQRILEILGGPDGVRGRTEALAAEQSIETQHLGTRTHLGEIIDPKCYLGAMKPGRGKTHRPCAMLCLLGGVPPMLVTEDDNGRPRYYLLTTPDNQRITGDDLDRLLPFVGVPVRVTGEASRRGDLLRLAIDVTRDVQHAGQ